MAANKGVNMKLVYPAIFTPLEKSDGYCVTFPDLPGCVTQGASLADAIEMAADAASGWVLDELEDGNEIPQATVPYSIGINADEFVSLILLDIKCELTRSESTGKAF